MIHVWMLLPFFGIQVLGQSQCQVDLLFNEYTGDVSRTNFGTPCQAWSSQKPFQHSYTASDIFVGGAEDWEHNYCRKTKDTPLPWCYTTDLDHGWDFCDWMICQPPSQPCGGLLTEPTGLMKSPDLDQDGGYDNWVECFWTIRLDWKKIIELTIVTLKMEFDFDGCLTDYLEAWEPHARLFKICYLGKEATMMKTQYNELEVHFFADETSNLYGFEVTYSEAEPPYCGGEVKGEQGEFRPIMDYGHYESNLNCTWFIRVMYFNVIRLKITELDIDYASPCEDYLQVFQFQTRVFEYKEIVKKICAQSGQIEVTSQTDLQVIFVTDDVGNQRTGFVAQFTQTLELSACWQGIAPKQYAGEIFVTDKGRLCQSWASQFPHEHTFTDLNFPMDGGILDALNYCRNPVGKGAPFCLTVDPELEVDGCGQRICKGNPVCLNGDVTMAYNGNVSTTNHGFTCQAWSSKTPHTHTLDDNSHYLHDGYSITRASNYCRALAGDFRPWCFTTNPDVEWDYCNLRICRGYDQQCGGTLTKKSGIMTSPDDDNNNKYDSYSLCMWTIESGPNSLTELVFILLNLIISEGCLKDYVVPDLCRTCWETTLLLFPRDGSLYKWIFRGHTFHRHVILISSLPGLEIFANGREMGAPLCGNVLPQPIVTTAALITVKFVSQTEDESDNPARGAYIDRTEVTGFRLKYKVVRFGEDDVLASTIPAIIPSQDHGLNATDPKPSGSTGMDEPSLTSVMPDSTFEPPDTDDETDKPSASNEGPTSSPTTRNPLPTLYKLRGTPEPTRFTAGEPKTTWKWIRMETWSTAMTTTSPAPTTVIETTKQTSEPPTTSTTLPQSTVTETFSVSTESEASSVDTGSSTANDSFLITTPKHLKKTTSHGQYMTSHRFNMTSYPPDMPPYGYNMTFNGSSLNINSSGTSIRFTHYPGILVEIVQFLWLAVGPTSII